METVINLIPSNYKGDPKQALSYCYQDFATKTEGIDVVVDTTGGVDWKEEAIKAMKQLGIDNAFVNCMWGNKLGGSVEIEIAEEVEEEDLVLIGETMVETASVIASNDKIEVAVLNNANKSHLGWCNKCHSHCYGDCEASQ